VSYRVTYQSFYDSVRRTLTNFGVDLARINRQIASGKRVEYASDDPVALGAILGRHHSLRALEQYERNLVLAESWLENADGSLMNAEDIIARARTLAEEMATDTYSAANRATAAEEVDSLIKNLLGIANTRIGNSFIFAGSRVYTAPFDESRYVNLVQKDQNNSTDYCGVVTSSGGYYYGHSRLTNADLGAGYWQLTAEWAESSATAALNYDGYFSFYYDDDGDYTGTARNEDIAGYYHITSAMSLNDIRDLINSGTAARAEVAFSGNVLAGDVIFIGGVSYVFSTAAAGSTTIVIGSNSVTANSAMNALVNGLNAATDALVWAVDDGLGQARLFTRSVGVSGNNAVWVSTADISGVVTIAATSHGLGSGAYLSGGGSAWVTADIVSLSGAYQLRLTAEDFNSSTTTSTYHAIYLGGTSGPLAKLSGATVNFFSGDYDQPGEWAIGRFFNDQVLIFAASDGADGNEISVAFVDPGAADQSLSISVSANEVTVSLATDGAGNVTTTLSELVAALEANSQASSLIKVEIPDGVSGSQVVQSMSPTHLSNGTTATSRRYVIEITTAGSVGGPRAAERTTILSGANNDLLIQALEAGTAGNDIQVRFVAGASGAGSTTISLVGGSQITVSLATDADGVITATAAQVRTALNLSAATLVSASLAPGTATGLGVVTEMSWATLEDGAEQARFKVYEYVSGVLTGGRDDTYAATTSAIAIYDELNSVYLGVRVSFTDNGTLQTGDKFYIDGGYYRGDEAELEINVGGADRIQQNVTGTEMMGGAGDVDNLLDTLRLFKTYLLENDTEGIQRMIVRLNEARGSVTDTSASVGARLNRLEIRTRINEDFSLTLQDHLAKIEDADVTDLITELNMKQVAYQASLTSITRITSLSLVDYL